MTRDGRYILDTVDAYRDKVAFQKPKNFVRDQSSWNVSANKRRADFTIVDNEIRTNNIYPAHVIKIDARHRSGWSHRDRARIPNQITAMIELSPLVPRATAFYIFRSIVSNRMAFATAAGVFTFIESVDVEDSMFENKFNFGCNYYALNEANDPATFIPFLLNATGIFKPYLPNTWEQWDASIKTLAPLQGLNNDYGLAGLSHVPPTDRITDLCDSDQQQEIASEGIYWVGGSLPSESAFCNPKPPANKSWLNFFGQFLYKETNRSSTSVTLGPDDLVNEIFDPSKPTAELPDSDSDLIERFVENYASEVVLHWQGHAERIGYPVPKPGKIVIGDMELIPSGDGKFQQTSLGTYFCQERYRAFWNIPYRLRRRLSKIDADEAMAVQQYYPEDDPA